MITAVEPITLLFFFISIQNPFISSTMILKPKNMNSQLKQNKLMTYVHCALAQIEVQMSCK